jgi:hypothetical protein
MDPLEEHNLAHPTNADEQSHALARTMLGLLTDQLAAKRPTPSAGERPGYQPPATACPSTRRPRPSVNHHPEQVNHSRPPGHTVRSAS